MSASPTTLTLAAIFKTSDCTLNDHAETKENKFIDSSQTTKFHSRIETCQYREECNIMKLITVLVRIQYPSEYDAPPILKGSTEGK
jgi:hypothetical protein